MASGLGETSRLLTEEYGCEVWGLDLSRELAKKAAASGRTMGFARADGENLPFKDGSFTALISECSICLLPRIQDGLYEASRILRGGGRLGLSDFAVSGPLSPELENVLMSFLCISSKISRSSYSKLVEKAGFASIQTVDVSDSIGLLLEGVRKRLLLAEIMAGIGKLPISKGQLERGKRLLSLAQDALDKGSVGYFMLTAEKP
jgi:arsenite methyltransferase